MYATHLPFFLIDAAVVELPSYVKTDETSPEKYLNPEAKIRARLYFDLIERFGYPPEFIEFDVVVPGFSGMDVADIVVYKDRAHTVPYLVVMCREDWVNDQRFESCILEAAKNAKSFGATLSVCAAGSRVHIMDALGEKLRTIPYKYGEK